jgi:hypothetical protein
MERVCRVEARSSTLVRVRRSRINGIPVLGAPASLPKTRLGSSPASGHFHYRPQNRFHPVPVTKSLKKFLNASTARVHASARRRPRVCGCESVCGILCADMRQLPPDAPTALMYRHEGHSFPESPASV